jgi:hypothetical protein
MRALSLSLLLLAAAGCAREANDADVAMSDTAATIAAPADDRARAAAMVSNAIAANPAAADSILAANGHTRDSFQQLMYDIAADSTLSATYAATKAP